MSSFNKVMALVFNLGMIASGILFLLKLDVIYALLFLICWEITSSTVLEERLKQKGVI